MQEQIRYPLEKLTCIKTSERSKPAGIHANFPLSTSRCPFGMIPTNRAAMPHPIDAVVEGK